MRSLNLFKNKFEDITTPFNITEAHFKQHNGIIAEVIVEHDGEKKRGRSLPETAVWMQSAMH